MIGHAYLKPLETSTSLNMHKIHLCDVWAIYIVFLCAWRVYLGLCITK